LNLTAGHGLPQVRAQRTSDLMVAAQVRDSQANFGTRAYQQLDFV
jgi:hypothetical protein